nr:DNA polymerase-like [Tanacetum cinerariifolium]GFA92346.1 DNA polymerase-like [Tanacetum cinerariifolium]
KAQQLQDDCDVQATNIILHSLPPDVYALVYHQEQGEDLVECINKAIAFLSIVALRLRTTIVNNIHKTYAAGLMMVHPGKMIEKDMINHTYNSEDYKVILDSFEERSRKVMIDLISMIERLVKQEKKSKTVYFRNFSRFDGIFLLGAYDSDCDDLSSAKVVLMAYFLSYDLEVLFEVPYSDSYPNDMINQDV